MCLAIVGIAARSFSYSFTTTSATDRAETSGATSSSALIVDAFGAGTPPPLPGLVVAVPAEAAVVVETVAFRHGKAEGGDRKRERQ